MAFVEPGFSVGTRLGVMPTVATFAAPHPLFRAPDDIAERVALVIGNADAGGADIGGIQRHRQPGEPLEDEGEPGKLRRPQKLPEKQPCFLAGMPDRLGKRGYAVSFDHAHHLQTSKEM